MPTRTIRAGFFSAIVIVLAIQAIPFGRDHTNPPVRMEPRWNSPQARQLAVRACYDCHSNETVWPWYSNIAPGSWLVQRDVREGRHELNFSEWDRPQEGEKAAEAVQKGKMPPESYVMLRPDAKLSVLERQALIREFQASLGGDGREQWDGEREEEEDREHERRNSERER